MRDVAGIGRGWACLWAILACVSCGGDAAINPASVTASASKTTDLRPGDKVTVSVSVRNFTLAGDKVGQASAAGSGHYHVYLDDKTGTDYLAAGAAATTEIVIPPATAAGAHRLRVQLFNNDHTAVSPTIQTEIAITVAAGGAPSVSATASKTADVKVGDKLTLSVTVQSFTLDGAKVGKTAEAGVGHYHVYLDDKTGTDYLAAGAAATTEIVIPPATTAGAHKLKVQLFNNDHTPLSPAVQAEIAITVAN